MPADTLTIRRIASPDEREILLRYARGHDTLRIAAGTGRGEDGIAALIGQLCGYDRGRAAQQIRAYDATHPPAPVAPPVHHGRPPNPETVGNLKNQIRDLKAKLAKAAADAAPQITALKTQIRDLKQRLTDTTAARVTELEADNRRLREQLAATARQADATQRQLLTDLRDTRTQLANTHLCQTIAEQQLAEAQEAFAKELKQLGSHLTLADGMAATYKARLDKLRELIGQASQHGGALIAIAAVRQALEADLDEAGPQ